MVSPVKLWWEVQEFCMQVTDEGGQATGRVERKLWVFEIKTSCQNELVLINLYRKGFFSSKGEFWVRSRTNNLFAQELSRF